jgi:DNA-binding GntR family transcriptional regulator
MASALVQLSSPTLADQAYIALREAIVAGELPRGEKITERGLADRLQVSPTPVREALRRLEQDHLVARPGPRSVRVMDFDATALAEVSAVEDTLRGLAARMAAANATPAQLAKMEAELDAADAALAKVRGQAKPSKKALLTAAERAFEHAREFHQLLDAASNSKLLLHFLKMVEAFDVAQRRETLHRQLDAGQVDYLAARFMQHRDILKAVSDKDEQLAEQLVLSHCRERSSAQA